jgi:hypothetical protein
MNLEGVTARRGASDAMCAAPNIAVIIRLAIEAIEAIEAGRHV